jgi:hypothetical protein
MYRTGKYIVRMREFIFCAKEARSERRIAYLFGLALLAAGDRARNNPVQWLHQRLQHLRQS